MPDAPYEANDIELLKANVAELDRDKKLLHTSAESVGYDRLVLATGSLPIMPPIPGFDVDDVFAIQKDIDYLQRLFERLQVARNVVIIGGGFIRIEFADEIKKMGSARVTIVEVMPRCLSLAYDDEFCVEMKEVLASRGITIRTSAKVEQIQGKDHVESIRLSDGADRARYRRDSNRSGDDRLHRPRLALLHVSDVLLDRVDNLLVPAIGSRGVVKEDDGRLQGRGPVAHPAPAGHPMGFALPAVWFA